ncbi:MAG: hypothetical protein A2W93_12160 [Bacteroidetes bacterium GWF2_43_63]|nr:MAG: hypothetical protein A2W94_15650 [Bacteroidetes bacterium GWE2_42_42]OFY56376.1 MAG: hypothetical protein A2W93_12160 [Bacteroidetes bacterium GWF2_43_63]HBG69658.1 hypothetical protein [Bacteroidales bacterium]HCB61925.1 hypothetical protein [Bacteroidales bacterium]HCY42296.1 hypothetical protein [Prolixibacteraceae bacterium]
MAANAKTTKPKLDAKTVFEELKTPGLIIIGMIGGNLAGKLIDKALPIDETATGFQAKALIKPIVQISAGIGGAIFLKDKNLKLIAGGVAASGIASTVKVFLKKDILSGLGDFNIADPLKRVFRDPINLAIAPYNPELPVLNENNPDLRTIDIESAPDDMGELADYEEIQEVQIL